MASNSTPPSAAAEQEEPVKLSPYVEAKLLLEQAASPPPHLTPSLILGERCLLGDPQENASGTILSRNPEKAVFYFNKAIIEKEPYGLLLAVSLLGFCYEFGLGVPGDHKRCEEIYRVSAVENEGLAIARLAFLKKYGRKNVNIDRAESELWAKRLVQLGPQALDWLKKAADQFAEPHAQYVLGTCYKDAYGVDRDPERAFHYFQQSAFQGYARAIGILGYCYGEGLGVEKDAEKALHYYYKAAEQDETAAIYNLGYCFEEGLGVARDPKRAFSYYQRAANLGNCYAQNSLGYCYEDGVGVDKDTIMAFFWYNKSAHRGYPWAQCNLGYCYQNGIGVPKDERKGAEWYYKAALQNHGRAQHNLAYCYQNGLGVPKNPKMAFHYFSLATEQGNVYAYH